MVKSRRVRWTGNLAHMWAKENMYRMLVGNVEGKRLLRRQRYGWEDNIKMDHR
jgi:hypothetical protein